MGHDFEPFYAADDIISADQRAVYNDIGGASDCLRNAAKVVNEVLEFAPKQAVKAYGGPGYRRALRDALRTISVALTELGAEL